MVEAEKKPNANPLNVSAEEIFEKTQRLPSQRHQDKWSERRGNCLDCENEGIELLCGHSICSRHAKDNIFKTNDIIRNEYFKEGCHIYRCNQDSCPHILFEKEIIELLGEQEYAA